MTIPARGRADYFAPGEWNVICFECGMKFKSSQVRRHWKGYYVCEEHWDPRHPQDFVKAVRSTSGVPFSQPDRGPAFADFVRFCLRDESSCIPYLAIPGCAIPGYIPAGFDYLLAIPINVPMEVDHPGSVAVPAVIEVSGVLTVDSYLKVDGVIRIS